MNGKSEKPSGSSWLWTLLILIAIGIFLLAIAIPNFTGRRVSKFNMIINNLRQIDAAKSQWAFELGVTNLDQIATVTNQLSEKDLAPYLHSSNNQSGLVPSVAGEIYTIGALNKSPEAKLVHKIEMPWPIGSIIRFSKNPKLNDCCEITLPDGTKTYD
jgi:hypothetical protein